MVGVSYNRWRNPERYKQTKLVARTPWCLRPRSRVTHRMATHLDRPGCDPASGLSRVINDRDGSGSPSEVLVHPRHSTRWSFALRRMDPAGPYSRRFTFFSRPTRASTGPVIRVPVGTAPRPPRFEDVRELVATFPGTKRPRSCRPLPQGPRGVRGFVPKVGPSGPGRHLHLTTPANRVGSCMVVGFAANHADETNPTTSASTPREARTKPLPR
jgi:hypothetical protein